MEKPTEIKHLAYLDGLRALSAFYVVLHHAAMQTTARHVSLPSALKLVLRFFKYGHCAVAIFIVLSGFCLMLPVVRQGELRGGAVRFFQRRARRILPPYFASIAICLLLINTILNRKTGSLWDIALPVTTQDVWMHVFLLQDLFAERATKINAVLWSVSVEWRIYLFSPILLALRKSWRPVQFLVITLGVAFVGQSLLRYTPLNRNGWGVCVHFVGLFCLGMMACECAFSDRESFAGMRAKISWEIATLTSMAVAAFVLLKMPQLPFYVSDFFIALWICCLLILLSIPKLSLISVILSWRPLAFMGSFAYSIYLIHTPVLQLVSQGIINPLQLSVPLSILLNLTIGPICSLVAAYLFFLCFERPFLSPRRKSK